MKKLYTLYGEMLVIALEQIVTVGTKNIISAVTVVHYLLQILFVALKGRQQLLVFLDFIYSNSSKQVDALFI